MDSENSRNSRESASSRASDTSADFAGTGRPKSRAHLYAKLPLVYSCSGCSSAAQLANEMALRLDREEMAEMSCIAGVGAGVPSLLRTAHSGRPMIVLDGCTLQCARLTLKNRGINPILPIDLSRHGVRKRLHEMPTPEEKVLVWDRVVYPAAAELLVLHLGSQNPNI